VSQQHGSGEAAITILACIVRRAKDRIVEVGPHRAEMRDPK